MRYNELDADAGSLVARQNISMADQGHVLDILDPHYADKPSAIDLATQKADTGGDLVAKFGFRHVGLMPAIRRDDAAIGLRRVVDDLEDGGNVGFGAVSEHDQSVSWFFGVTRPAVMPPSMTNSAPLTMRASSEAK